MKYPVVHNRFLRIYLFLKDIFLFCYSKVCPLKNIDLNKNMMQNVRILLCNPAALGDVLYTLRLAATLKKNHPKIQIGLLVGRWSSPLVELSSDIDYIHFEDHWATSRSKKNILVRFFHWWNDRQRVVKEIREKNYSIAVDLYYYFPSAAFLFYQAGIPCRVGYDSNGGTPLLSKVVPWSIAEKHNIEYQAALLEQIGFSMKGLANSYISIDFLQEDDYFLSSNGLKSFEYVIVHMGVGERTREWLLDNWAFLIRFLEKMGLRVCFTGIGEYERTNITAVVEEADVECISLCDQLTLQELFQIIKSARLFIGVESFAGHIAAMYQIPQISIMHGAANQFHWQPYHNKNCIVVKRCLDCSPCYFIKLCKKDNLCMDIPLEDVTKAVEKVLKQ